MCSPRLKKIEIFNFLLISNIFSCIKSFFYISLKKLKTLKKTHFKKINHHFFFLKSPKHSAFLIALIKDKYTKHMFKILSLQLLDEIATKQSEKPLWSNKRFKTSQHFITWHIQEVIPKKNCFFFTEGVCYRCKWKA